MSFNRPSGQAGRDIRHAVQSVTNIALRVRHTIQPNRPAVYKPFHGIGVQNNRRAKQARIVTAG